MSLNKRYGLDGSKNSSCGSEEIQSNPFYTGGILCTISIILLIHGSLSN